MAVVVLVMTVTVIAVCVAEATRSAESPHSNVRVVDGGANVYAIAAGDLLDRAGIRAGDRILSINGVSFVDGGSYSAVFQSLRSGDLLLFVVEREGESIELSVRAAKSITVGKLVIAAVPIVVLLLAGAGVFFAGPRSLTALLFLLFCASSAINDASQLPVLGGDSLAQKIIIAAYTLFSIQSPALGLHLFVLFPSRGPVQRWLTLWLPLAYGIQTALGLSYFLPAFSTWWAERLANPELHPLLLSAFNTNVVICSALSAISLAAVAIWDSSDRVRLQARLLFFAFFLLTALQMALYTVPLRFGGRMPVSAETYTLLDLIVPAFVAAAVLFHRLWDIDILVRQGFIYGAASVVVGTVFAAVFLGFGRLADLVWDDPDIVVIAAAAVFAAMLFQPVQRFARRWIDRVLYRKRYSYHQLLVEIGEQLATVFDLPAAAMLLRTRITGALEPETLTVAIYREPPGLFEAIGPDGLQPMLVGAESAAVAEELARHGRPFRPLATDLLPLADSEIVVPIVHGNLILGFIMLGPRRSAVPYLPDDLDFLAAVARQAAPVLENAGLVEERAARERLAMVGTATAAIAHEIKNPLAAIKSTAAILRRRLKSDLRGQELTMVVEDEVDRLEKSVVEVLSFVRQRPVDPVPIDLAELVSQLASVVEADFARSNVTVTLDIELKPGSLRGDPDRLRQALLNLLLNARDAMPRGGEISIVLRSRVGGPSVSGVEILVSDNGSGFSDDVLPTAFEPFVSGKRLGTGLGLANVRRIVEEHEGLVEARNRARGGAEVSVWLPNDQGVGARPDATEGGFSI